MYFTKYVVLEIFVGREIIGQKCKNNSPLNRELPVTPQAKLPQWSGLSLQTLKFYIKKLMSL
jgi:hypothetical protein